MTDVPDDPDGVNTQPRAVPAFEKSPAAIPDTDSENDTPNVNVMPAAGELGADATEAVGGSRSIVMAEELVAAEGPVCDVTAEITASCATVSTTVPDVTFVPDNPTTYDAPEPENDEIDQPVLVPPSETSDCNRSVTDSLN